LAVRPILLGFSVTGAAEVMPDDTLSRHFRPRPRPEKPVGLDDLNGDKLDETKSGSANEGKGSDLRSLKAKVKAETNP
jgi:hypothetical protein